MRYNMEYKLCVSGPKWVLEAIKHLMNEFTNKHVTGPYDKNGAGKFHIHVKDKN